MAEILDHSDNFKAFAAPPYSTWRVGLLSVHTVTGATIVCPQRSQSEYIMKTIQEEKIAAIILVPVMTFFICFCQTWRSTTPAR